MERRTDTVEDTHVLTKSIVCTLQLTQGHLSRSEWKNYNVTTQRISHIKRALQPGKIQHPSMQMGK